MNIGQGSFPSRYPFKYCPLWSKEQEFVHIVRQLWLTNYVRSTNSTLFYLPSFLRSLKVEVAPWISGKKLSMIAELRDIELSISVLSDGSFVENVNNPIFERLKYLEERKCILLKQEEELWRIKSRALWLTSEDKNTSFFHAFATSRKMKRVIWEVVDDSGRCFTDPVGIATVAIDHFSRIFTCPTSDNLAAQMYLLQVMPSFFF